MADTIINVVTVTAPGRYAALAIARAVVSDALKLQAPSPIQLGSDAPVVERRIERCLLELAAADPAEPPLFRRSIILRALTWKTLQQPSSRASALLTGCSPCL